MRVLNSTESFLCFSAFLLDKLGLRNGLGVGKGVVSSKTGVYKPQLTNVVRSQVANTQTGRGTTAGLAFFSFVFEKLFFFFLPQEMVKF